MRSVPVERRDQSPWASVGTLVAPPMGIRAFDRFQPGLQRHMYWLTIDHHRVPNARWRHGRSWRSGPCYRARPSVSTTRPSGASPTGTEREAARPSHDVVLLDASSSTEQDHAEQLLSRLSAIPTSRSGNSSMSPATTLRSSARRPIPSPTERTPGLMVTRRPRESVANHMQGRASTAGHFSSQGWSTCATDWPGTVRRRMACQLTSTVRLMASTRTLVTGDRGMGTTGFRSTAITTKAPSQM
jgi:hypothetical protein